MVEIDLSDGIMIWPLIYWSPGRRLHLLWPFITWSISGGREVFAIFYFVYRRTKHLAEGLSATDILWPLFHYESTNHGTGTSIAFRPIFWYTREPDLLTISFCGGLFYYKKTDEVTYYHVLPLVFSTTTSQSSSFLVFPVYYSSFEAQTQTKSRWILIVFTSKTPTTYTLFFPLFYYFKDETSDTRILYFVVLYFLRSPTISKTYFVPIYFVKHEDDGGSLRTRTVILLIWWKWTSEDETTLIWALGYYNYQRASEERTFLLIPIIYSSTSPHHRFVCFCLVYWRNEDDLEDWMLILPILYTERQENWNKRLVLLIFYTFHEKRSDQEIHKFRIFPIYWSTTTHSGSSTSHEKLLVPIFYTYRVSTEVERITWVLLYYYFYDSTRTISALFPVYWDSETTRGDQLVSHQFVLLGFYHFSSRNQEGWGFLFEIFLSYQISYILNDEDSSRKFLSSKFLFCMGVIYLERHSDGSFTTLVLPFYYNQKDSTSGFGFICFIYFWGAIYFLKDQEIQTSKSWTLLLPIHYSEDVLDGRKLCIWAPLYYHEEIPETSSMTLILLYFSSHDFVGDEKTRGFFPIFYLHTKGDESYSLLTPVYIRKSSTNSDFLLVFFGLYFVSETTSETHQYRRRMMFPIYYTSSSTYIAKSENDSFSPSEFFTYCALIYWRWSFQKSQQESNSWVIVFPIFYQHEKTTPEYPEWKYSSILLFVFAWSSSEQITSSTRTLSSKIHVMVILFRYHKKITCPTDADLKSQEPSISILVFPIISYKTSPELHEIIFLCGLVHRSLSLSNSRKIHVWWVFPIVYHKVVYENMSTNVLDHSGTIIYSTWNIFWLIPNAVTLVKSKQTPKYERFFIFPLRYSQSNSDGSTINSYFWLFLPALALYYRYSEPNGRGLTFAFIIFWLDRTANSREFNLFWLVPGHVAIFRSSTTPTKSITYFFPLFYHVSTPTSHDFFAVWIFWKYFSLFRTSLEYSNEEHSVTTSEIYRFSVLFYFEQRPPSHYYSISLIWIGTKDFALLFIEKEHDLAELFRLFPLYYSRRTYRASFSEAPGEDKRLWLWFYPSTNIALLGYHSHQSSELLKVWFYPLFYYSTSPNKVIKSFIWIFGPRGALLSFYSSANFSKVVFVFLYWKEKTDTSTTIAIFWLYPPTFALGRYIETPSKKVLWFVPLIYAKSKGESKTIALFCLFSSTFSLFYHKSKPNYSKTRIPVVYYTETDSQKTKTCFIWLTAGSINLIKSEKSLTTQEAMFHFFPVWHSETDKDGWWSYSIIYFFSPSISVIGYRSSQAETIFYVIPIWWQHDLHSVFDRRWYFLLGLVYVRHKEDSYHFRFIYRFIRYKTGNNGRENKKVIEVNPFFQYREVNRNGKESTTYSLLGGFMGYSNDDGTVKLRGFWCCVC